MEKKLFAELEQLGLGVYYITRLKLGFGFKRGDAITICCVVNDIIRDFNSDQETENKISEILNKLLKIHFTKSNKA